jgi:hypothetical protein
MKLEVQDGRAITIRGDQAMPFTDGLACVTQSREKPRS